MASVQTIKSHSLCVCCNPSVSVLCFDSWGGRVSEGEWFRRKIVIESHSQVVKYLILGLGWWSKVSVFDDLRMRLNQLYFFRLTYWTFKHRHRHRLGGADSYSDFFTLGWNYPSLLMTKTDPILNYVLPLALIVGPLSTLMVVKSTVHLVWLL